MRRGKNGTRIIKLTKSNCRPTGETVIILDEKGVGDKQ
jgi:hypothetical protein